MSEIRNFAERRATSGISGLRSDVFVVLICGGLAAGLAFAVQSQISDSIAVSHVMIEKTNVSLSTELEALRAPDLADSVIKDLHLMSSADFSVPKPFTERLVNFWESLLQRTRLIRTIPAAPEQSFAETKRRWSQSVSIAAEPETRVLKVAVALDNSDLAIEIANDLAKKFVAQEIIAMPLSTNLDKLRQDVVRAQADVDAAGAVDVKAETAVLPQNIQMLEDKARKIKALLARGHVFEAVDLLDQPALRAMSDERRSILEELQIQGRTLLDRHPTMIQLHGRLSRVEAEIRAAIPKAAANLESELNQSRALINNNKIMDLAPAETPLVLQQRLRAARQRLDDRLLKIAGGEVASVAPAARYRIFVPAEKLPIASLRDQILYFADIGFYGCAFGLALVFLRRGLRIPPVEMRVPVAVPAEIGPVAAASLPGSPFNLRPVPAESNIMPFNAAVLRALADHAAPHVVLFNGFAHEDLHGFFNEFNNLSAIIVDLGPPSRNARGLGDLLGGYLDFEDVIRREPGCSFDFLASGRGRAGRLGLDLVVATLGEVYDVVILNHLDVAGADLEDIAPLVTLAILAQETDMDEENFYIGQVLQDAGCSRVMNVLPPRQHALPQAA